MTPAELWRTAIRDLESAQVGFLEDDQEGAKVAALISIAASLALLARPPGRQTYGELDVDERDMDRQELWDLRHGRA